jgi:hypothetical protein
MPRRTRALPALASPCSRRFAPLSSGHSAIACWFTVTNLPLNSARAAFWSSTVRDEPVIALALGVRAG